MENMSKKFEEAIISRREREPGEYGRNVEINYYYWRHAQKQDASVGSDKISGSPISEKGRQDAFGLGKKLKEEGIVLKNIGTTSTDRLWSGQSAAEAFENQNPDKEFHEQKRDYNRTQQTAEEILRGNESQDDKIRRYFNLGFYTEAYQGSEYFFAKYKEIADKERDCVLRRDYGNRKLEELDPDEQEKVMYEAEEPAIEWYLQHQDMSLEETDDAKRWYEENGIEPNKTTTTPKASAALAAYQLNRLLNLPQFMKNSTVKNYFTIGNQMASEPFLAWVALAESAGVEHLDKTENNPNFDPVGKLREMGGTLKIMEGWHLKIKTDDEGKLVVKLNLRGKDFDLDLEKVRELAEVGGRLYNKKIKKIDTLYIEPKNQD